jgi:hypothetical protein
MDCNPVRRITYAVINIAYKGFNMANKIITVHYTNNGVPQPGLTPTIDVFELDPLNPGTNTQVVTAGATVEIGMGFYRYDFATYNPTRNYVFMFDGGVSLTGCDRYKYGGNESYAEDIAPATADAVWDEQTTDHLAVGTTGLMLSQIKADTASILISEAALATLLNTLLKYERNRTKIDVANAQMIIYDDDCITPLTTFELRDFNGMPSVQEVCERVPTTC